MILSIFQSFKKVLAKNAHNLEALHNLCVVYLKRGSPDLAKDCFENVKQVTAKLQAIKPNPVEKAQKEET